jgi:hypothetical protein
VRKIFEALSIFDWITPLVGMAETAYHDPTLLQSNSWTLFIPYDNALRAGWNERDIRELLDRQGISSWGSQITNGELFFNVSSDQAEWAQDTLREYGVPLNEKYTR